jgi:hypothetical protein
VRERTDAEERERDTEGEEQTRGSEGGGREERGVVEEEAHGQARELMSWMAVRRAGGVHRRRARAEAGGLPAPLRAAAARRQRRGGSTRPARATASAWRRAARRTYVAKKWIHSALAVRDKDFTDHSRNRLPRRKRNVGSRTRLMTRLYSEIDRSATAERPRK